MSNQPTFYIEKVEHKGQEKYQVMKRVHKKEMTAPMSLEKAETVRKTLEQQRNENRFKFDSFQYLGRNA